MAAPIIRRTDEKDHAYYFGTGSSGFRQLLGCRCGFRNLSRAADQFEVFRRAVFYNGITGEYILTIEGFLSILDEGGQLEVTVKADDGTFLKHFLGLSDNVTYFVEQIEGRPVSEQRYRVVFKPSVIVPDIDLE
jgi:hypothetical protein